MPAPPTKPTATAGQGSDFGLSDLASFLSPAYAMTQGKSPFAGGLLGMAAPGMGPTPEQASGFGGWLYPGAGLAGLGTMGLGSLMQPQQAQMPGAAQQLQPKRGLGPLAGILPAMVGRGGGYG